MARKSIIVLVLACVFVFSFASMAFAAVGDAGLDHAAPFWSTTGAYAANATTATPHLGFSTNTYKCAVCHVVHDTATTGEVLLRSTVANACTACHLDGSTAIKDVYASDATQWTNDLRSNHSATSGLTCTGCHGVHGANCVKTAGWDTYILRKDASLLSNQPGGTMGAVAGANLNTGTDASLVLSNYCTQCHAYYTAAYDTAATAGMHVMKAAGTTYTNGTKVNIRVANADSTSCTSCHDIAGSTVSSATAATVGFPHNVPLTDRFMNVAPYVGGGASAATLSTTGANPFYKGAQSDGACVKCHLWANGANGAGVDF